MFISMVIEINSYSLIFLSSVVKAEMLRFVLNDMPVLPLSLLASHNMVSVILQLLMKVMHLLGEATRYLSEN